MRRMRLIVVAVIVIAAVGAGLAWADVTQTRAYAGIEREAYVKGLGIHGKNCLPPTERGVSQGPRL